MTFYSVVNFIHVLGSIAMFVALGIERLTVGRVLNSGSSEEFRHWLQIAHIPTRIGAPALGVTLLSGVYLWLATPHAAPWVLPSILGLVVIAMLGAFVTGPTQKQFISARSNQDIGPTWGKIWLSLQLRLGLLIGILYLMVMKPSAEASLVALMIFALLFAIPLAFFWRKYGPLRVRRSRV